MNKFNYRIDNLEVRSCGEGLMSKCEHDRAEIVEWAFADDGVEYCFTLAYFVPKKDNEYNLHFVGNRPFQHESWERFMALANFGYETLTKLADKETSQN